MEPHKFVKPAKSARRRTLYSEEDEKTIARRVANGETQQAVADDLNVHRNTVCNICARHPGVVADEKELQRREGNEG